MSWHPCFPTRKWGNFSHHYAPPPPKSPVVGLCSNAAWVVKRTAWNEIRLSAPSLVTPSLVAVEGSASAAAFVVGAGLWFSYHNVRFARTWHKTSLAPKHCFNDLCYADLSLILDSHRKLRSLLANLTCISMRTPVDEWWSFTLFPFFFLVR